MNFACRLLAKDGLQHEAPEVDPDVLESINEDIESFLLSLPLGTDSRSAEVEQAVASRLYESEVEKAVLKKKLAQW